jgi:hypothetical protein
MVEMGKGDVGDIKMGVEKKNFDYAGEVHMKAKGGVIDPEQPIWGRQGEWVKAVYEESKITDVRFLTPAKVTFTTETGEKTTKMAYIDIINKEAFDEAGNPFHSELIFEHLDSRALPTDFFMASDEIRNKATEVRKGFETGE